MDTIRSSRYIGNALFEPVKIRKASVACEGLCKWVRAMSHYDIVARIVAPKRVALRDAESKLELSNARLAQKQGDLRTIGERAARLAASHTRALNELARLNEQCADVRVRMCRSQDLLQGLSGEKSRWAREEARLERRGRQLRSDLLLAAGAVAYLGVYPPEYRRAAAASWSRHLTHMLSGGAAWDCGRFDAPSRSLLARALCPNIVLQQWASCGLPRDGYSVDSAAIVAEAAGPLAGSTGRWPLILDPQRQATRWLRRWEARRLRGLARAAQARRRDALDAAAAADAKAEECAEAGVGAGSRPSSKAGGHPDSRNALPSAGVSVSAMEIDDEERYMRYVVVTKADDAHFARDLERAVSEGRTLIVEDVGEDLGGSLMALLRQVPFAAGRTGPTRNDGTFGFIYCNGCH